MSASEFWELKPQRASSDVRYGSLADMIGCMKGVRFTPESRHFVRRLKESAKCHKRTYVAS